MFVKVCGITTPDDATAAALAGVDAIGLNFVPTSRRQISLDTARRIVAVVPPSVMTVGVFRDQPTDELLDIVEQLGLHAAQLHGSEPPAVTAEVASSVGTVIKAFPAGTSVRACQDHDAEIVLIDSPEPGSGRTFDWELVHDLVMTRKVLLAGGLHPGNVGHAVGQVGPWGVDAASGVETSPRRKSLALMIDFVASARAPGRSRPGMDARQ